MRTTFSLQGKIDYYPITIAFPIMHTSYDLIRWLRTLSTESRKVMILRSTTIHFQTDDAVRIMYDEEEKEKKKKEKEKKRGKKRERERTITGMRYVKYAWYRRYRSFGPIESRNEAEALALRSRKGRARVRISWTRPSTSE